MASEKNPLSSGLSYLMSSYVSDDETDDTELKLDQSNQKLIERLPLPSAILNRNILVENNPTDDPMLHDGRLRSFPHQRGNWASHFYVPYNVSSTYSDFCEKVIAEANHTVKLVMVQEPHISLTRTFILFHHWIDSFVKSVEEQLRWTTSFYVNFGKLSAYVNEEKTRTFVGLTVSTGFADLVASVEKFDESLKEFKLPTFYENPSFHMSFVWCLGDQKKIVDQVLPDLDVCFRQFLMVHPDLFNLHVTHYFGKIGNKTFIIRLKES